MADEKRPTFKGTSWFHCVHCKEARLGEHVSTKTYHGTKEVQNEYKCPYCGKHTITSSGGV